MFAADTACFPITKERDNGDCEVKCYKTFSDSNTTTSFALEIVNDIVEKAMNIAENTLDMIPQKIEKISPAVVGDIIDNILFKSPVPPDHPFAEDETVLLDEEIKKIINEMKCPPDQKPIIATTGVGDQLTSKSEITLPDKILEPKRNTLERKGRLTNLVRNSKHLLTKLVSDISDSRRASNSNLEEVSNERVIKVIDFEYGFMGHNVAFNMQADHHFIDPTVYPYHQDTVLEVVDLETVQNVEPSSVEDTRRFTDTLEGKDTRNNVKKGIGNRKRWNFGARILRYFRRHSNKREEQRETR